ncbi:hypothetical protein B2J93_8325 [Marssonina coronariae]|uniref:Uncharacterized protein n=1 Tax=Diplocarpon coronariae TaxID=2795749 RepID=A0A218ZCA7_9HELO|nr:hypothetical protein B2J93_8325 [Marssonina coronariae]
MIRTTVISIAAMAHPTLEAVPHSGSRHVVDRIPHIAEVVARRERVLCSCVLAPVFRVAESRAPGPATAVWLGPDHVRDSNSPHRPAGPNHVPGSDAGSHGSSYGARLLLAPTFSAPPRGPHHHLHAGHTTCPPFLISARVTPHHTASTSNHSTPHPSSGPGDSCESPRGTPPPAGPHLRTHGPRNAPWHPHGVAPPRRGLRGRERLHGREAAVPRKAGGWDGDVGGRDGGGRGDGGDMEGGGGDMEEGHGGGTWRRDMEEGHGGGTWRRDMEEGHGGGTWRRDMEEGHGGGDMEGRWRGIEKRGWRMGIGKSIVGG